MITQFNRRQKVLATLNLLAAALALGPATLFFCLPFSPRTGKIRSKT